MPSPSTASQSRINAERLAHLLPKGNPPDSIRPEHALIRPPSLSFADLQKAPVAQRLPGHLIICTPSPPFATIRVSGVDAAPRSAVGVDAKEQTWHGPPSTGCRTGV